MHLPTVLETLDPTSFQRLTAEMLKEIEDVTVHTPVVVWCDAEGNRLFALHDTIEISAIERKQWIAESFRWGEAYLALDENDEFAITVALSQNQELIGGIILGNLPLQETEHLTRSQFLQRLRYMGETLVDWATTLNLINEYLMLARHNEADLERDRAQIIHSVKKNTYNDLHNLYETIESELTVSMRRGDRADCIRLLNEILLRLYAESEDRFSEIRELMLELVLIMRRTAIDSGVNTINITSPQIIWKEAYQLKNHEDLTFWAKDYLITMIDQVAKSSIPPEQLRVKLALTYIRKNSREILTRSMVAQKIGLSEGEFSRMIKRNTGKTFQQHLLDLRISDAVNLLRQSPLNIGQIALECGFESSSHFSYAFRKHTGKSPSHFRQ